MCQAGDIEATIAVCGLHADGRTPNRVFYNAADPTQRNANVNFFADYNNLALIALAVVSGGLLAWPTIARGTGGKAVNTVAATQLINKRGAVVVDIREAAEYAKGHLPQAKSAPLADLAARAAALQRTRPSPSSWYRRPARAWARLRQRSRKPGTVRPMRSRAASPPGSRPVFRSSSKPRLTGRPVRHITPDPARAAGGV